MKVDSIVITDQTLTMSVSFCVSLVIHVCRAELTLFYLSVLSVISLSHLDANAASEPIPSAAGPKVTAGSTKICSGGLDSLTLIHTHSDFLFSLTNNKYDTIHTWLCFTGCVKQAAEGKYELFTEHIDVYFHSVYLLFQMLPHHSEMYCLFSGVKYTADIC